MPAEMPPAMNPDKNFVAPETGKDRGSIIERIKVDQSGNLTPECVVEMQKTPEGKDILNVYKLITENGSQLSRSADELESKGLDAKTAWKKPGNYRLTLNFDKMEKEVGDWLFCKEKTSPYYAKMRAAEQGIANAYDARNLNEGQKSILNDRAKRVTETMMELSMVGLYDALRDGDSAAANNILTEMNKYRTSIGAQEEYGESLNH